MAAAKAWTSAALMAATTAAQLADNWAKMTAVCSVGLMAFVMADPLAPLLVDWMAVGKADT
jgi:uncharacterized protein (UPF0210 family)